LIYKKELFCIIYLTKEQITRVYFRRAEGIQVLRSLYRELRPASDGGQVRNSQLWGFIVGQIRTATTPPASLTEEEDRIRNLTRAGELFVLSIRSTQAYLNICSEYKGKGERSATEMASLMGFSMPDQPRTTRKSSPS